MGPAREDHITKSRINWITLLTIYYNSDCIKITLLSKHLSITIKYKCVPCHKLLKYGSYWGNSICTFILHYFPLRKMDRNLTGPPRQCTGPITPGWSKKPRFTPADHFPTPR